MPGYAARMSGTVDRFLDRLRPLRAFIRDNWGLTGIPALYLPNQIPPVSVSADNGIYLRREEQGFLKLSCTGAVIFSIRTTITPWETRTRKRTVLDYCRG